MSKAVNTERARRLGLALVLGAVVASVGLWAQNDALVGVNYDDAIYVELAKSIASGDGYRLMYTPQPTPGVKYPPVYPLSLVPPWVLAGSPAAAFRAMKRLNGIYIGVAAGLLFLLLVQLGLLPTPLAALVTLLGFLSGSMMLVTAGVLSEPLYLVLLFAALLATDRAGAAVGRWGLLAIALLTGMACLTRMAGVTLVPAVLISIWWRQGRRRALVVAAGITIVLAPWLLFTVGAGRQIPEVLVPRYGSYVQRYLSAVADDPTAAIHVAATNLRLILQTLGTKLLPRIGATGRALAGACFLVVAGIGSRVASNRAPASATYPWFYLLLISVWTFPPFRFVFILVPLLLGLAAVGIVSLANELVAVSRRSPVSWLSERSAWARYLVLGVAVILAVDLGYREVRSVARRVWERTELVKSDVAAELIAWTNRNTDPSDVIAFELDPMLALHTGRTTVPNNWEPSHPWYEHGPVPVTQLARLFTESGVDYVAVRRDVAAAAAPIDALMGAYPGALELVHVTPRGVVILRTHLSAFADGRPEDPNAATREPER